MNSSPKHVSAEASATARRTKCAPAERSRKAAGVSDINTKLFDQKSWITARFQAMMSARAKQRMLL
jgi:hypothetical protein